MPLFPSKAFQTFLNDVDTAKTSLGIKPGFECYYRGQRCGSYELSPSLFRTQPQGKVPAKPAVLAKFHDKIEYDFFFEFRARARELHTDNPTSWDVLFVMQHYGAPTRLLDWTEVLGVALFFALDRWDPSQGTQPCIWLLNPYRLNDLGPWGEDLVAPPYLGWDKGTKQFWTYEDLLIENEGMDWDLPVAVYPELRNSRIHAQRGSFTMHGDDHRPLENQLKEIGPDQFGDKTKPTLQKVCLPIEAIEDVRKFLDYAGITRDRLYPELPALALSLREKYQL